MTDRTEKGALDPYYIEAYLDNPAKGKTAALRAAYKAAGMANRKATRQRAHDLHNRLRDEINKRLVKLAVDYKALGLKKLAYLCESAEAETVQLAAAKTLTTDLFPNVTIERIETIDDIDAELESIEAEIAASNGVRIQ